MTTSPHRARRRARWALGALVLVNLVVLWFYVGASASLGWHVKMLDERTVRACSHTALLGSAVGGPDEVGDPTFVGDSTIRFPASATVTRRGREVVEEIEVECRLGVRDPDASTSDDLVVEHAAVVR